MSDDVRAAAVRESLGCIKNVRIGLPVTVDDCADLYKDMRSIMPEGTVLDICMRGTDDRRHDGAGLRIEIVADGQLLTLRPAAI